MMGLKGRNPMAQGRARQVAIITAIFAVFVIAFLVLVLPSYFKGREISRDEAVALIGAEVKELTAPDHDYAELFSKGKTFEEESEPTPGQRVITRIYVLEIPVVVAGVKTTKRQIGRVSVRMRTGDVGTVLTEILRTLAHLEILKRAGKDEPEDPKIAMPAPAPRPAPAPPPRPPARGPLFPVPEVRRPISLLVVTNYNVLRRKHPNQFGHIQAWLQRLGSVYDTSNEGQNPAAIRAEIRRRVRQENRAAIFIFGNGDVVPFKKRKNPCYGSGRDDDIIFGDGFYADLDDDRLWLPDVDVGRIPDDPEIIRNPRSALYRAADSHQPMRQARLDSVANFCRPTADDVVAVVNPAVENQNLFWSEPHTTQSLPGGFYQNSNLYLILHGSLSDGSRYTGESSSGRSHPEAFNVNSVAPAEVVLSGACYGGHVLGKTARNSIALAFLARGCRAFIGHSGSSYSDLDTVDRGQAHFVKLFLEEYRKGAPPSTAFRLAMRRYAQSAAKKSDLKHIAQLIFYGIPALYAPGRQRPPAPPMPTVPAIPVATRQPVALTEPFDGKSLDPTRWTLPKVPPKRGTVQVRGGQLVLGTFGTPGTPVPIFSTHRQRPFIGDWTVVVRLSFFRFRGSGQFRLIFGMQSIDRRILVQQGILFASTWRQRQWRTCHGLEGRFQQMTLLPTIRTVTLVMQKQGGVITYYVSGQRVHTVRLTEVGLRFFLTVLQVWEGRPSAEAHIDHIYVFGSRGGEPGTETKGQVTKPKPPKKGLPGVLDMHVELTWDKPADVDLHVYEPDGQKCWYKRMKTKSGAFLDRDDRTGTGPEMYSLGKTKLRGQYKIFVCYYSGGKPVTATVKVHRGWGTPTHRYRTYRVPLPKADRTKELPVTTVTLP